MKDIGVPYLVAPGSPSEGSRRKRRCFWSVPCVGGGVAADGRIHECRAFLERW